MSGPLDGVLVVSLEQAVAAPFLTCRMADAGARVIKLERSEGDFARGYDDTSRGLSSFFVWLNRGKESLAIDIKNDDDQALLHRILSKADVWVQNLAPGATERAGFGSAYLREMYPRLITVDISGYGEAPAPFDTAKAYDLLVQAESGLMAVTGSPAEPSRVGVSICDLTTGINGLTGVLEALYAREKTGRGAGISVSMFDAMADLMAAPVMFQQHGDKGWPRTGLRHNALVPYGAYSTGDGRLTMIAIQNEREWKRFAEIVLEQPSMATDERCQPNKARMAHREFVEGEIDRVLGAIDQPTLQHRLRAADIAHSSVNSVEDMVRHPALRRIEVETVQGVIDMPAPPVRRADEIPTYGPPPTIDAHGTSIRAEFKG
jgi:itaconate CoA-transferase